MHIISDQLATNFRSTFISLEKQQELIWKKLFVNSKPYSDKLKRLLIINAPDCLDENNQQYQEYINKFSLKDMKNASYFTSNPKILFNEHEEKKAYVILEFDDFAPTENSEFNSMTINFTIMCHLDCWELDDYKLRPYQIAGYIDGLLNECKLTGIGRLNFLGGNQVILTDTIGGIVLKYMTYPGSEDSEGKNKNLPTPQDLGNSLVIGL